MFSSVLVVVLVTSLLSFSTSIHGDADADSSMASMNNSAATTSTPISTNETDETQAGTSATTILSSGMPTADSSPTSTVIPRAATTDAATTDAATTNATATDTGATNAATTDAATTNAATTDTATTNAATTDTATTNAGTTDAATTNAGTTNAATTGPTVTDAATTDAATNSTVVTGPTAESTTANGTSENATTTSPTKTIDNTTQDIDECSLDNNCDMNANCTNSIGGYSCECNEGYRGNGSTCEDIDECDNATICPLHSTCNNTDGSYQCDCDKGFEKNETMCQDIDECDNATICPLHSTCNNTDGSYQCDCDKGFEKNETMCQDIDECDNATICPLHSTCNNTDGSYQCDCDKGFEKNETMCQDIDECDNATICPLHSTCNNTNGSYQCDCDKGFEKNETMCQDIDECDNATICPLHSTCNNTDGSYQCDCDKGFEKNETMCQDINECFLKKCDSNANCTNMIGNYSCECHAGYTGNGTTCDDIDECTNATMFKCTEHSECHNTPGSYKCDCNPGFMKNGSICEDVDECSQEDACDEHANCKNVIGNFTCTCLKGYQGDGKTCEDVDECENETICPDHSTCNNFEGNFSCDCNRGYSKNGTNCEDINECLEQPCDEHARCNNTAGDYTCSCNAGYKGNGKTCEVEPLCPGNCTNSVACSQTKPLEYTCICKVGWEGQYCEKDLDECKKNPCDANAYCNNTDGSYNCTCKDGFETVGETCREKFVFELNNLGHRYHGDTNEAIRTTLPIPFPYFGDIYQDIYVYTNGYVAFGVKFQQDLAPTDDHWPSFPPLVAVQWTNLDIQQGQGSFLSIYQENILQNVTTDGKLLAEVKRAVNNASFQPLAAVAVTWMNVHPYPMSQYPNDMLRAQLVLASDGLFTYLLRNYDVTWTDEGKDRRARVSTSYSGATGQAVADPNIPTNGTGGRVTSKLFTDDLSDLSFKCFKEIMDLKSSSAAKPNLSPCPCWDGQADKDPGFKKDNGDCYKSRFWFQDWKQTCCYDGFGLLLKNVKDAQYPESKTNTSYAGAYSACCDVSKPFLCSSFYAAFPSDDCSAYVDKSGGGGFGDPHIINFDKDKFTFNIVGDFSLFKFGEIELQGRTTKSPFGTTSFQSYAIQMSKTTSPYIIKLEGGLLTHNWRDDSKKSSDAEINMIKNGVSLVFPFDASGVSLSVKKSGDALNFEAIGVVTPEGIMGNSNKDQTDDFEGVPGPAAKLTGEQIQVFAEKFRITVVGKSLYGDLAPDTGEMPSTPPNPVNAVKEKLKSSNISEDFFAFCEGELFCLQDYLATKNETLSTKIKEETEDLEKNIEELPNAGKPFTNRKTLQWFLSDSEVTIELNAPDATSYEKNGSLPGVVLNEHTLSVLLLPERGRLRKHSYPTSLTFTAKHSEGPQVSYKPHIELCLCEKKDQCTNESIPPKDSNPAETGNVFNMGCQCEDGKEGRYCEKEYDVCQKCQDPGSCNKTLANPCICPDGFKKDDKNRCIEVDECQENNGNCDQVCTNTIGGAVCSCHSGFEKDGPHCLDIEECTNMTTCGLLKFCVEEPGSYSCHCYPGFGGKNCIRAPYRYPGTFSLLSYPWNDKYNDDQSKVFKELSDDLKREFKEFLTDELKMDEDTLYVDIIALNKAADSPPDDTINVTFIINSKIESHEENITTILKTAFLPGSSRKLDKFLLFDARLNDDINLCNSPRVPNTCDQTSTTCSFEDHQISCSCKDGFERSIKDPFVCEDIDECQTEGVCGSFPCVNAEGDHRCICDSTHTWNESVKNCTEKPDPCSSNPCLNGGLCSNSFGKAVCSCSFGHEGPRCEKEQNESRQMKVAVIAISCVLGAFCLILIIVIAALCCRMRKSIESDSYSTPDYSVVSHKIPRPKLSSKGMRNGSEANYDNLNEEENNSRNNLSRPDYDKSSAVHHVYRNKAYDSAYDNAEQP